MPELPEVEIFKSYLQSTGLHQMIEDVHIPDTGLLDNVTGKALREALVGRPLQSAHRYGKYLFAGSEEGGWLMVHFGMTGALTYFKRTEKEPDHLALILVFDNGYQLAVSCPRTFCRLGWREDWRELVAEKELGPDALDEDFDVSACRSLLEERRGTLKGLLMNQQALAGIGNLYSDEILFQLGIHPQRKIGELEEDEKGELHACLRRVLRSAIECRVGERGWPEGWLVPVREEGADCPRCAGQIQRLEVSGRGCYHCSQHQV